MEKVCLGLYLQLSTNPGCSHTSPGSTGRQRQTTTGAPGLNSRKEVQKPECYFGHLSHRRKRPSGIVTTQTRQPTSPPTDSCVLSPQGRSVTGRYHVRKLANHQVLTYSVVCDE